MFLRYCKKFSVRRLRFLLKHGDADLLALLEQSTLPVELDRIGIFRSSLAKFRKQARLRLFLTFCVLWFGSVVLY